MGPHRSQGNTERQKIDRGANWKNLHGDKSVDPGVTLNTHSCKIVSYQSKMIEIDETVHDNIGADT